MLPYRGCVRRVKWIDGSRKCSGGEKALRAPPPPGRRLCSSCCRFLGRVVGIKKFPIIASFGSMSVARVLSATVRSLDALARLLV